VVDAVAASEPDFPSWYEQHHRRLVASIVLLSGDLEVARDVVDEAFTRAFARWKRVRAMGSPIGWTYVVAVHELRRRERRRRHELSLLSLQMPPADLPDGAHEIWLLLHDLPERQRTAVVLRHVADLTEHDIAAAMGVTRSTVSNTLRNAYAHLRSALLDEEEMPDARHC
jgi:RNA polymerase sigma-70 factor (ECF subfamily)